MEVDPVSNRIARAKLAAEKAENEANDRIQKAALRVRQAEAESENQIKEQRDRFERQAQGEAAIAEGRIDNIKSKNYEDLGRLKHQTDMEAQRLKRDVEKESSKLKENYEQINEATARAGEKKLQDQTVKNYKTITAEQQRAIDQTEAIRAQNAQTLLNLQNEHDIMVKTLRNEAEKKHKALEEQTLKSAEQDQFAYAEKYDSAMSGAKHAMETLDADAKAQLEAKKLSYQRKLNAYSNSRSDPFYQPVTIGARLSDKSDHFMVTANIPENEQSQVSVTMKGDKELVISGHRRSEEKIQKDGHTQTTSNYQTYTETIPLSWPVDPKAMTKEWDGDRIIVRLPKLSFDTEAAKVPKKIVNARMQRPQFPKDLPTEEQLAKASDKDISGVAFSDPKKKPAKRVFTDT